MFVEHDDKHSYNAVTRKSIQLFAANAKV